MLKTQLLATLPLLALTACVTNSISGRTNLHVWMSDAEQVAMGEQAYAEYLKGSKIITGGAQAQQVQRVMDRLVAALGSDDPGFPWEVRLVRDDNTVNAWCLPGGKMAVYTGILPVTQDEAGLAVVMGHEIAHAVAEHGARRVQVGKLKDAAFDLARQLNPDFADYSEVASDFVEVTALLPFGREDELESDTIGLILMARAGYDPREAPRFWSRMAAVGSSETPEFLSTHPSDETRIASLEARLPEALAIYESRD